MKNSVLLLLTLLLVGCNETKYQDQQDRQVLAYETRAALGNAAYSNGCVAGIQLAVPEIKKAAAANPLEMLGLLKFCSEKGNEWTEFKSPPFVTTDYAFMSGCLHSFIDAIKPPSSDQEATQLIAQCSKARSDWYAEQAALAAKK